MFVIGGGSLYPSETRKELVAGSREHRQDFKYVFTLGGMRHRAAVKELLGFHLLDVCTMWEGKAKGRRSDGLMQQYWPNWLGEPSPNWCSILQTNSKLRGITESQYSRVAWLHFPAKQHLVRSSPPLFDSERILMLVRGDCESSLSTARILRGGWSKMDLLPHLQGDINNIVVLIPGGREKILVET